MINNRITIDTSLENKLELRRDYARMVALCYLQDENKLRESGLPALPKDVIKVVRSMLADNWREGVVPVIESTTSV